MNHPASSPSISTNNSYEASRQNPLPPSPTPSRPHPTTSTPRDSTSSHTSTTTTTPPPPHTTYTFHWICPRPSCHTCTPLPRATHPLPATYFLEYEDADQAQIERELEMIGLYSFSLASRYFGLLTWYRLGANVLSNCNGLCAARQVYRSPEAKVGREWSYVQATCCMCERRAGRGSCLVRVDVDVERG